jgi:hypothetical protein
MAHATLETPAGQPAASYERNLIMPMFESFLIYQVPISQIIVGERYRKDLGDLDALVNSIRNTPSSDSIRKGMLQPIVINEKNELIAGQRRLEAAKLLGWREVPCIVSGSFDDTLAALRAERDENTCRKDFTPSEAVALGKDIEKMEKRAAKERQKRGGRAGGQASGNLPEASKGQTRDKVAEVIGMSGRTYEKAKRVVEAAEKEPEKHAETVREMDKTGNVEAAYRKVKSDVVEKGEEIKELGKGVYLANEAINSLSRIPRDDALRERGFQIVEDWIMGNGPKPLRPELVALLDKLDEIGRQRELPAAVGKIAAKLRRLLGILKPPR